MVGVRGFRPDLPESYLNRFALRGLRSFGSFFIAKKKHERTSFPSSMA